jgi:hypothetical protein
MRRLLACVCFDVARLKAPKRRTGRGLSFKIKKNKTIFSDARRPGPSCPSVGSAAGAGLSPALTSSPAASLASDPGVGLILNLGSRGALIRPVKALPGVAFSQARNHMRGHVVETFKKALFFF